MSADGASRSGAHNTVLTQFLEARAADLAQSSTDTGTAEQAGVEDGLVFLGEWNESYPGILVRDPFLTQSAKVQFLYLMQEAKSRSMQAYAMPSGETTAQAIGQSRKTVTRDRLLLRITRWISLYQQVRDRSGRFRGGIYALHSEPAPLGDATALDADYMTLLHECRRHADLSIRNATEAALAGIDDQFARGEDPTAPPDRMGRRVNAQRAIAGHGGNFFDLMMDAGVGTRDAPVSTDQADESTEAPTGGPGDDSTQRARGQPCVDSTHGANDPCVDLTHGSQDTDQKRFVDKNPQAADRTHGAYSSSGTTSTTTGDDRCERPYPTETASSAVAVPAVEAMRWPDDIDQSQRHLIHQALVQRQIEAERFQDVVDVLAHKAADATNPLRSPVAYAVKLCERIKAGTFQAVGPPDPRNKPTAASDETAESTDKRQRRDLRCQIRHLQCEIQHMQTNLIDLAPPQQRPRLESQRDQLQARLTEKQTEYRALGGPAEQTDG
ncbi:hypothetical protein [Salinisphaera orenii]|uniref:hypothetical protein n=1 Tax=Salinisphaera orenii TaxID=856731 RepID=UPI000DBE2452